MQASTFHQLSLDMGDLHPAWLDELVATEYSGYQLTYRIARLSSGTLLTTAVVHGRRVAGYAQVVIGRGLPRKARQRSAFVVPEHRGHGLLMWVGAAMLQRLRDEYPWVAEIETDLGADRVHLLEVSKQLGFRLLRLHVIVERT